MYYHDLHMQYKVEVSKPDPLFARMLQQAIGGVEGEVRVCMQYMMQGYNMRGPSKYRDLLLETATEELSHIEILATAIALNLEGAPTEFKDDAAEDQVVHAAMGGMDMRHVISSGLGSMLNDSNGVPFNGSWVVGSGNIAADMYSNVAAEATGRALVARLKQATNDKGMKDMLSFLLARDTMHQQQWLAVLEELGGVEKNLPIPNSTPDEDYLDKYTHTFVTTNVDETAVPPEGRWSTGPSIDGKSEFTTQRITPDGGLLPKLKSPMKDAGAQIDQKQGPINATIDKLSEAGKNL